MSKTKLKDMSEVQEEANLDASIETSVASPASEPEKSEDEAMRAQEVEQSEQPSKKEKKAKAPKRGKKERSKNYQQKIKILEEKAKEGLEEDEELPNLHNKAVVNPAVYKSKTYPVDQAIELAKQLSMTKFDGSIELHINTNSKQVRGLVSLPYASGKILKVLAFGKGAEESGADLIGDDKALAEIEKGKVNFDVLVTTPEWMPKLARAAKVLGPKGLMPNPKNGTISTDLKKAITEIQSGKIEYKTEKESPVIHLGIGKVSQPTEELNQNIKILLATIGKSKIKKVTIAPTMGPGVKIELSSI